MNSLALNRGRAGSAVRGRSASIAMVLLGLMNAPASATVIMRQSIESMTAGASHVAAGRVENVECHWTDDHTQIYTYVTLQVDEMLKGEAVERLTFVFLGGRVDDVVLDAPGLSRFEKGEEVLVFLYRMTPRKALRGNADLFLLGIAQGKWLIGKDARSGRKQAELDLRGVKAIEPAGGRLPVAMEFERLKSTIRREVAAAAAAERPEPRAAPVQGKDQPRQSATTQPGGR